jgi:hypothetical protein
MSGLRAVKIPIVGGRLAYLPKGEDAGISARQLFGTRLFAKHLDRHGHVIDDKLAEMTPDGYDLGSGLTTNIGVLALAGDSQWPQTSIVTNLFKLLKYHASGTGVTAAAFTDVILQTPSGFGGQTPVAGTQVFTHDQAATTQKWVSVATIAYTGGEAVTEWGIFNDTTLSRTTGTPFTGTSANTATVTATPLTASSTSVQGESQHVVLTTTTPRYGLITSNSTSVLTLSFSAAIGWMVTSTGVVGSTPGATEAYTLRPVMWDHKVFSAINVVNLDSIQFTYTLTIASNG